MLQFISKLRFSIRSGIFIHVAALFWTQSPMPRPSFSITMHDFPHGDLGKGDCSNDAIVGILRIIAGFFY